MWATRRRLLRRALLLAGLDRLVAVAFSLIERSLSVPPTFVPRYPDIVDLLTFVEPGVTGGLLSLYAVLLVATPLLEAALRRVGRALVLAASGGLFVLVHAGALGEPSTTWPFPVAYWQLLFVAGVLCAILILQLLIGTPATWHLAPEANVRLEVATGAEADANIASADEEDPDPEPTPWFMDLEADGYPGSSIDPEAISPEETGSETQG